MYHDGVLAALGVYDGTSDVMYRNLFRCSHAAWEQWKSGEPTRECTCGLSPIPVVVYAKYACGVWWESHACLKCMVLTGISEPYEMPSHAKGKTTRCGEVPYFVDRWSLDEEGD